MIRELEIHNFRGFESFKMKDLGRINLLVGMNNSGKTSVLEAIQMLCSRGDASPVWDSLFRRGEMANKESDRNELEMDVRHLFRGHDVEVGGSFQIVACEDVAKEPLSLEAKILDSADSFGVKVSISPGIQNLERKLAGMSLNWTGAADISFSQAFSSDFSFLRPERRTLSRSKGAEEPNCVYMTSSSLSVDEMVSYFEEVVLTPSEDLLMTAIRKIEPRIIRVAPVGKISPSPKGGFFVKCSGNDQRIPIGSLGDGVWRMLGLALALVRAKGGVLLIDEIDTGLHYTVMSDMWKFLLEVATELDVQVFATTHSSDCYRSLASIAREDVSEGSEVTIQRIEKDKKEAVPYSERQIVIADNCEIEVR